MSRSQVDTDPTQTRAGPPITSLLSTFGITYILWAHLTIFIELSEFHLRSRVKKLFSIRNEKKWWRTQRRTWNNIFFSSFSNEGFYRGIKMVKRESIVLVFGLAKHSLNHSSSNSSAKSVKNQDIQKVGSLVHLSSITSHLMTITSFLQFYIPLDWPSKTKHRCTI